MSYFVGSGFQQVQKAACLVFVEEVVCCWRKERSELKLKRSEDVLAEVCLLVDMRCWPLVEGHSEHDVFPRPSLANPSCTVTQMTWKFEELSYCPVSSSSFSPQLAATLGVPVLPPKKESFCFYWTLKFQHPRLPKGGVGGQLSWPANSSTVKPLAGPFDWSVFNPLNPLGRQVFYHFLPKGLAKSDETKYRTGGALLVLCPGPITIDQ